MPSDTAKMFLCDVCGKSFTRRISLKQHKYMHASEKSFKCSQCEYSTKWASNLSTHMHKHNGQLFPCDDCGKFFTTRISLKQHKFTHSSEKTFKCSQCDFSTKWASNLSTHMQRHPKKNLRCDICGELFATPIQLEQHRYMHFSARNFKFGQTDASAKWSANLQTHMQMQKYSGKMFPCEVCGKCFRKRISLKQHKFMHAAEKSFKCTQCDYSTKWASNLSTHMQKHNEKKFRCVVCTESFTTSILLEQHKCMHPSATNFRFGQCDYTANPSTHMQKHNGQMFPCDDCGKSFTTRVSLKQHKHMHSAEKTFKCSQCDYSTKWASNLSTHMQKHTAKVYRCDICTESFTTPILLEQHKYMHSSVSNFMFGQWDYSAKYPVVPSTAMKQITQ